MNSALFADHDEKAQAEEIALLALWLSWIFFHSQLCAGPSHRLALLCGLPALHISNRAFATSVESKSAMARYCFHSSRNAGEPGSS